MTNVDHYPSSLIVKRKRISTRDEVFKNQIEPIEVFYDLIGPPFERLLGYSIPEKSWTRA